MIEKTLKYNNPFYRNYIFTKADLERRDVPWWRMPFYLWFTKTYVQIAADCDKVFFYKTDLRGATYILKVEDLPPLGERSDM